MFKLKQRYFILIALILLFSVPSFSQESTAEPAPPTEAPTAEIIVTEAPTEVASEVPTAEIILTEAPTEAPIITEEAVVTEAPTEAPIVTEVPTEANPIPTEAPANDLAAAPRGDTVEMLLQYNPNASADSIAAMLRALGAVELERIPQIGAMRVLIPSAVSNTSAAQSALAGNNLASIAGLMSIEPNIIGYVEETPNDPLFSSQSNLKDATANGIFMESAWSISPRDGLGVTVAVLDTGLDLQHPEFMGKFVAGWDFYNDDNDPDDDQGHGTHVAGVIAARTNNGIGVASIAFNSMILPVKVCSSGIGSCPVYETAAGLVYAVDRGAKVINMSLAYISRSTTLEAAVNYALARNVVVVAAAGNDGATTNYVNYPASYAGVISVGAINTDGSTIASFSNTNSNVTVAAPGVNILSTWPTDLGDLSGYFLDSGTSMASPHVAALAALLIADGIASTPAQVREALICSALDKGSSGYDTAFGYGFIQADYALTWNSNSSACQISLSNDLIQNATAISNPTLNIIQPVNNRSVTESASDPSICGNAANQTLWYRYTPNTAGNYMISTLGSAYDTLLGVYQGQPGALTELTCNDDYTTGVSTTTSLLTVSLMKNVSYYILIGTKGGEIAANAQLNINLGFSASTLQQETASFIRYTGTWNRLATTGASGGSVNQTSDINATMTVLVRGTSLKYTRMVGPAQGDFQIFVDNGAVVVSGTNRAAFNRSQTITMGLGVDTGQWHVVTIRMFTSNGTLNLDALQVVDGALPRAIVGATRLNETASAFTFPIGTWDSSTGIVGALGSNVIYTSDQDAFIEFRMSGTALTVWRATGAGTGTMNIYLDNVLAATVLNNDTLANSSVPFSIANLPQRERVVRIVNADAQTLSFDGAQSLVQSSLVPNVTTDERSPSIVYSGIWTRTAVSSSVANAGTLSVASDANNDPKAAFMFNGNHFCIGYQTNSSGGMVNIILDGVLLDQIDTFSATTFNKVQWCSYDNGHNLLTDSLHTLVLDVTSASFSFDFVRPVRRTVFTVSSGYVAESNTSLFYSGIWTTSTQKSEGGYAFQGGSARRADVSTGGGQTVSWTMNGTGFILYTAIDLDGVAGAFEVYVDGSGTPMNVVYQGSNVAYIDLWEQISLPGFRFRPIALGVVDLGAGMHTISLEAIEPFPGQYVYFDGIRVLP